MVQKHHLSSAAQQRLPLKIFLTKRILTVKGENNGKGNMKESVEHLKRERIGEDKRWTIRSLKSRDLTAFLSSTTEETHAGLEKITVKT